jgi:hypothetical protein
MTDTSTPDAPPVFGPNGMQGNITSSQGQPPAQPGGSPLAPQSPLATMGAPPAPTPPPQYPAIKAPPMPAAPNLQQNKEPPPDAKEYQKNAMEWASAFAVLGAISGRFTRAPGGAALGAFGAALKGWQSGNLQAYQTAADQWEKQSKQALDNNKLVLEQYKMALENRKMNIDEQMSNIQLIAAKYHDQMMYDAASAKNYTMVAQLQEKGWRATAKGYEFHAELSADNQEIKQKQEQNALYWLSPEGTARLPQLSPVQQANVKQIIELYAGKQAKPQNEVIEQFKREHPDATAEQIQEFIASGKPPRAAPAMFIAQYKKEHPNATAAEIEKAAGDYAGSVSYGRAAGGQGARVENAVNEVEQLIPQAVEASHNLPRGKFVNVNQLMQSYEKGTSDPAYNDFALANFSLVNAYTRAMNPQGVPRIQERLEQHAAGILSTATSPEAYDVQVRRLWKEVQASKTATAKTAQGRSPGDINSPVPGLDDKGAATSDDGWTVKVK